MKNRLMTWLFVPKELRKLGRTWKDRPDMKRAYSADDAIAWQVYPLLVRFQKNVDSYPYFLTLDEWNAIIEKMVNAFELYVIRWENDIDVYDDDEVKEGLRLFYEYFHHLWY